MSDFKVLFVCLFCFISLSIFATDPYVISSGVGGSFYNEFAVDVLTRAYTNIGLKVSFSNTSLERSLILSNNGDVDGDVFRSITVEDDYPNLLRVNEPIFYSTWVGFTTDENIVIAAWEDLKDYKIAVVRGMKRTVDETSAMNRVVADTIVDAFVLLEKNRVDIVVDGRYRGLSSYFKLGFSTPLYTSVTLDSSPLYHYVNKKNRDIIPQLEIALKDIQPAILFKTFADERLKSEGGSY